MKASLTLSLILVSASLLTASGSSSKNLPSPAERKHYSSEAETESSTDVVQLPKTSRRRKRWLSSHHFGFIKSEKFSRAASKAVSCCQYGLIAYLIVGVIKDLFSTIRELNEEFSSDKRNGLSKSELEQHLSHHLRMMTDLPHAWIDNILERLKGDQARMNMLYECLLHSNGADRRTTLESVGGLAVIKQNINDWISFNCRKKGGATTPYDDFVKSAGSRQGLVFWGPPGCGKSLLIKAIVSESRLPTLFVTPSLIQNKYYGETSKRVKSLFELVAILSPFGCIIVLDELDGLFKSRNSEEIEVSRDLKTEWLQWWDGVASDQNHRNKVLFIGATNRPWDCDPAVWRRLQQRHYVGVPSFDDRLGLFQLWANTYKLPSIEFNTLEYFARQTEGYIPSDLFHIMQSACRNGPMKRLDQTLTISDIQQALGEISPTRFTMEYVQQIQSFLGQPQQQQNPYASTDRYSSGGSYFETPTGSYFQYQVPVDPNEISWSKNQNDLGSDFNSDDFDSDDFITDSDFDEL